MEVLKEVLDAVDSQHPEVYFWSIFQNYKFCLAKIEIAQEPLFLFVISGHITCFQKKNRKVEDK